MMTGVRCYRSAPQRCNYLPDRQATSIFIDPAYPLDSTLYSQLCAQGFRRSGRHVYRPDCPGCQACIPLRVDIRRHAASRSQRRVITHNTDLEIRQCPGTLNEEQFQLMQRYLAGQHPHGGMNQLSHQQCEDFLFTTGIVTRCAEFRLQGTLLAVAVSDVVDDGLSAVYTFYDPAYRARGLGTLAILHHIDRCRREGRDWLYLGYWIKDSRKMNYKTGFRPCQLWDGQRWQETPDL
ncbi:MAG: arginyltransferase [Gammaproteobacteria bacterium]|nr:arginyltransferase [Gammaproteobacteria bacterium]